MLKEAFNDMLGQARQLQARYLPEMQAKARTLNAAQVIDMVRQG
jgi:hypothetical protein